MAEKHQQVYPLAPANLHTRSDAEMANSNEKELKRKKRIKLAIYITIFAVFQTIVIVVFALVIMRAKAPKLSLSRDFEFQKLETVLTPPASFDMRLATQVRVKNPNWGPYKFQNSTVSFSYNGATVGEVVIPRGKAGIRATKKLNAVVNLNSKQLVNMTSLGAELSEGTLKLTSTARVNGKVELMFIMKKNKSATMNCTIIIDVVATNLKSLECK